MLFESPDLVVVAYTLSIYAAIVMSPGPNFALVSRLALQGRRDACNGAIVGLAAAATFYAILAMVGLAAILTEIAWLARGVQIVGGLYLIYLGISAWRSAGQASTTPLLVKEPSNASFNKGFRLGAIVTLSNPKAIAFFVGLYAVAVPIDASIGTRMVILLGGVFLELSWYGLVSKLLSQGAPRALYQAYAKWIDRVIGSVLVLFGTKLIFESRSS